MTEPRRFCKITPRGSELLKSGLRTSRVTRERLAEIVGLSKRTLRRVLNQGYPAEKKKFEKMVEAAGLDEVLLEHCLPHYSHKWRPLRMPSHLEPGLARALGYVLGDGDLGKRCIRMRDERLPVLIAYKKIFADTFRVKGTITPIRGKRCYQLAISSAEITALFRYLVREWKEIVPRSNRECVASFIRGFADAEGSVQEHVYISSADRSVLETVQLLLLRFGVKSTIGRAKGAYLLRIAEGTSLANFRREIDLTARDKARRLAKAVAEKTRIGGDLIPIEPEILWDLAESIGVRPSKFVKHREQRAITRSSLSRFVKRIKSTAGYKDAQGDVIERVKKLEKLAASSVGWERIRSITRERSHTPVYDVTVSPHANFVANGLLVHNSHTRIFLRRATGGPVRIARLVSSPYLPEGERIFKITEQGIRDITEEDEVKRRR
jgi:lambda repressor-like predicted transcriptional regulator